MNMIARWVTCEGKWLKCEGMPPLERELVSEAVKIYWATVCPDVPALVEVQAMDWTGFAAWWLSEFRRRGFDHRLGSPGGENPTFRILQDIEARIGIHQEKMAKPTPFCPSYWPFWA